MARAGAAEGYWLRADRQSGGRGRLGRSWSSPPGNLYASTLIRLRQSDPAAASLAFVAGLAVHELLLPLAGSRNLSLKWPNDLLLDGTKCVGILLEREGDVVVLGIGINLASAPDIPGRATTAFAHGDIPPIDPAALMPDLASRFAAALGRWRLAGLPPILSDWQARAHPLGTNLSVSLGLEEKVGGRFAGLAADGALMLEQDDGSVREIRAADVEIVRERS
ncbi:biotin--[acetyl-CoA-carboxylase] ligase [Novosphingopyxis sp.]|uniref:biotin--[acetyl-CoA-carboxylase] ligase n=1 Tax=Novosphingopyxis sp. TaxID=2709690 RepID=UPI003B5AD642